MSTQTTERPAAPAPARRRWYAAAGTVALAAVVLVGVLFVTNDSGDEPDTLAGPPLALSLGANDALASCLAFDVAILADMPLAFEGTATTVDGETITLRVDRWFKGGDAETVTLTGPAGLEALIGGVAFAEGGSYLITATDGVVNYCGYSAEATPELRAAFEQAFAG